MNLKILFIISDNEKKILRLLNKFKLPYNNMTHALGTASKSMLNYFGLIETEKILNTSIISDFQETEILQYLKNGMQIQEIGQGIAFTVPLSSSSSYVKDSFKVKENVTKMENNRKYHLLLTIVQEGFAEKAMTAAKKFGANGGTVIKGRGVGTKSSFKLLNMTIEPGKDIILIVCEDKDKNKIMTGIIDKVGIKTEAKGICLSMPIDNVAGLEE